MKATELIRRLTEMVKEHGDAEVVPVCDEDGGDGAVLFSRELAGESNPLFVDEKGGRFVLYVSLAKYDEQIGASMAIVKLNVEEVKKFRDYIIEALNNAVENGYDETGERPEDVADNMTEYDAELEVFNECNHLLVPYIEEWMKQQKIKKGRN